MKYIKRQVTETNPTVTLKFKAKFKDLSKSGKSFCFTLKYSNEDKESDIYLVPTDEFKCDFEKGKFYTLSVDLSFRSDITISRMRLKNAWVIEDHALDESTDSSCVIGIDNFYVWDTTHKNKKVIEVDSHQGTWWIRATATQEAKIDSETDYLPVILKRSSLVYTKARNQKEDYIVEQIKLFEQDEEVTDEAWEAKMPEMFWTLHIG